MATSLDLLQKTVADYKGRLTEIANLYSDTQEFYTELQEKLQVTHAELPVPSIESIPNANQMSSVMFIGNRNCGKSTLLNVLLRKRFLPTHSTPCTSRIVRAVYSKTGNYAKLVDEKGGVLKQSLGHKRKSLEKLVVLEDKDKYDMANLKAIVEVGLEHEFLESGIELIDSPGRCETDALEHVVEGFLQTGMVPLIVYVIDGNQHVVQKDKETIRELQDKFPNISLMFVCNKCDVSKEARAYDHDDEEDATPKSEEEVAKEKKQEVFRQLKHTGFIPQEADIDSSSVYHGISAVRVQEARKGKLSNDATRAFDRLQVCILERLSDSLRRQCQKALSTLLSSQEMVLSLTTSRRKALAFTKDILPAVCEQVMTAEASLYETEMQLLLQSHEIASTIRQEMESLTREFLQQAEDYQTLDQKTLKREFNSIRIEAGLNPSQGRQIRLEELLVLDFVGDMKGAILDKTFNALKTSLNGALRESLSSAIGEMIKLSQSVSHPFIGRLLQRIYEMDLTQLQEAAPLDAQASLVNLHEILDGLFETINAAVTITLRREISTPLSSFQVTNVGKSQRPRESFWRRKVVQTLLSMLDYERISKSISDTCANTLFSIHKLFQETVKVFRQLNESFRAMPAEIDKLRSIFVPRLAELTVRGYALQFLVNKGQLEIGELVTKSAHSLVYECTSASWGGPQQSVVKVIDRHEVGDEVWKQTMVDTIHTKDIFDKLGGCPTNHLKLVGWEMPTPTKMRIVMDRVKVDLLDFLQEEPSWQQALKVSIEVAKGMAKIHEADYVYQDLKPQNILLSSDGVAKINLCKPEKPFEKTKLGWPFHISPDMYTSYRKNLCTEKFDVYAFGSLLWVICEGSGQKRPRAFEHCNDNEAMKEAVIGGVRPERPDNASDACWELMNKCWSESVTTRDVIDKLTAMTWSAEFI